MRSPAPCVPAFAAASGRLRRAPGPRRAAGPRAITPCGRAVRGERHRAVRAVGGRAALRDRAGDRHAVLRSPAGRAAPGARRPGGAGWRRLPGRRATSCGPLPDVLFPDPGGGAGPDPLRHDFVGVVHTAGACPARLAGLKVVRQPAGGRCRRRRPATPRSTGGGAGWSASSTTCVRLVGDLALLTAQFAALEVDAGGRARVTSSTCAPAHRAASLGGPGAPPRRRGRRCRRARRSAWRTSGARSGPVAPAAVAWPVRRPRRAAAVAARRAVEVSVHVAARPADLDRGGMAAVAGRLVPRGHGDAAALRRALPGRPHRAGGPSGATTTVVGVGLAADGRREGERLRWRPTASGPRVRGVLAGLPSADGEAVLELGVDRAPRGRLVVGRHGHRRIVGRRAQVVLAGEELGAVLDPTRRRRARSGRSGRS